MCLKMCQKCAKKCYAKGDNNESLLSDCDMCPMELCRCLESKLNQPRFNSCQLKNRQTGVRDLVVFYFYCKGKDTKRSSIPWYNKALTVERIRKVLLLGSITKTKVDTVLADRNEIM